MIRNILIVVAAAAVGGGAVGWFVLGTLGGRPAPTPPSAAAPADGVEAVRRFALTAADVPLDRETPAVAADAKGRVLVAWASQTAALEHTIFLARSADGGTTFDEPSAFRKVPIYRYKATRKGQEVTYSTSAETRLAVAGEAVYLGWTEAVDGGPKVVYYVARSDDGGRTFAKPAAVPGGEGAKPGFTDLSAGPDGAAACAWLDHRNKVQVPFYSVSDPNRAQFGPAALVYAGPPGGGVCPCCDAAVTRGRRRRIRRLPQRRQRRPRRLRGPIRRPVRSLRAPVAVNPDHWRFEGCPHDGPALAVAAGRLHVLWMDGHAGRRRVYYAASDPSDLRFTPRELSPGPGEQGHPKLAAFGTVLHAVWDAGAGVAPAASGNHDDHHHSDPTAGGGRTVQYARSANGGEDFGPARDLDPRPGAFQVNPAVAVGPAGDAYVVWNEITEAGKSVAFVRVPAAPK